MFDDLQAYEARTYSQNGEDGVLTQLFELIGSTNRFFVEFGAGPDGAERNTRLLEEQGWCGVLWDCQPNGRDPKVHHEHVTAENVNRLFARYNVPDKFDLLSIDIDGNDYWVWNALSLRYRPQVVVIEYNAGVVPTESRTIAYEPSFRWQGTDYYGASLSAMALLGRRKGYTLVYCESTGVNAFFVWTDMITTPVKSVTELYRPLAVFPRGEFYPADTRRMMAVETNGIAGVVVARNEELNIVRCLESLSPHVAEILLVDMESSDRTVELARPYVSKVLTHPLVPVMDVARHAAISETSYDWFWFVDADEFVPYPAGHAIADLIRCRGDEFEALQYPFKTFFCRRWMQHNGWWPGYTVPRVLKRGHFRFSDRLHMGVHIEGRQVTLDPSYAVPHHSYRSIEHWVHKFNRYTSTEALQLAQRGIHWDWRFAMRAMVHDLWEHYELHNARLDGNHGWILTWLMSQYRWFSSAKLIDRFPKDSLDDSKVSVPQDLDEAIEVMAEELSALRASRPRVPLDVVLSASVFEPSGDAEEGRTLAMSIAQGARLLAIRERQQIGESRNLSASESMLFRALCRAKRPKFTATVSIGDPVLTSPDPCASLNILRTTCRTDRLPPEWLPHINAFDEIWVNSQRDVAALRRSWVPPEKIRVLPNYLDTNRFTPRGAKLKLPDALSGRFVFLSVLSWQYRHGWDVLLRAYCNEFGKDDGVGLLLKVSSADSRSMEAVRQSAERVLSDIHQSLANRPDIVFWNQTLSSAQMPALYRSAHAFVRTARGEGSRRVYLEAMACGLPVIAAGATADIGLMDDRNCVLVTSLPVDVTEHALRECPVYRGHRWHEPDLTELQQGLRLVHTDEAYRRRIAKRAVRIVRKERNPTVGSKSIEVAMSAAEARFRNDAAPPVVETQLRVELEGEFFAFHSLAGVNEQLALEFQSRSEVALSLRRVKHTPTYDQQSYHTHKLRPLFNRSFDGGPQVTIRHAFPPNWQPPNAVKWIHIQPWEYGHLPLDWIPPLRDYVDETWVYSEYVRRVYQQSGIPSHKIRVIPLGIEPKIFNPGTPSLILPTTKSFAFLFVGGVIERKGADIALRAYLDEFSPTDDVCLVVKDIGSQTFYRNSPCRDQLLEAAADPSNPTIVYLDQTLTDGQMASLYTACHCLIAPYRGEGFGLPILEAMACGVVPIVPQGGPSDDFVTEETGFLLPSATVETSSTWDLCGPATELQVDVMDVRRAMRAAYEDRAQLLQTGRAASRHVLTNFTWSRTVEQMTRRLQALVSQTETVASAVLKQPTFSARPRASNIGSSLCAFVIFRNDEATLSNCLVRLAPFVDEMVVVSDGGDDRSVAIAQEYGARVYNKELQSDSLAVCNAALRDVASEWLLMIAPDETLAEDEIAQIRRCAVESPLDVLALSLQVAIKDSSNRDDATFELRVFRRTPCLVFEKQYGGRLWPNVHRNQFQIVKLPMTLQRSRESHNVVDRSAVTGKLKERPKN